MHRTFFQTFCQTNYLNMSEDEHRSTAIGIPGKSYTLFFSQNIGLSIRISLWSSIQYKTRIIIKALPILEVPFLLRSNNSCQTTIKLYVYCMCKVPENRGSTVEIVLWQRYAITEDYQASLKAGFDSHLAKPVQTETLVSAFQIYLIKTLEIIWKLNSK